MKKPTHEKNIDVMPTKRQMATRLREQFADLELDDTNALAAAAILMKFSLSLYRGTLTKEEIAELLQHSLSTLDEIEVLSPTKRTIN